MKPKVAVVYHSGTGHTKKQAEAVHRGAASLADSCIFSVDNVDWDKLDEADAIIFGAPTYMGSASFQFKKFMDETSSRWFKQAWQDKIAGGFTNSGYPSGDKFNTLVQLTTFAAQHQMIWVGVDPMPKKEINRLGSSLGPMAHSLNDSPEVTPPESDLKTAEIYGKRVASITLKFKAR
jgi:multimeric flavodoxin WrbA